MPAREKQKRRQLTGLDVHDEHEGVNKEMGDACIQCLGAAYIPPKKIPLDLTNVS